jgi:hypothetical protein
MMYPRWSIIRIREEKKIMDKELPQFKLFKSGDMIFFRGWHTTTTSRLKFQLKLPLPTVYPDVAPKLYVTYPLTLVKYGGGAINSMWSSHAFHTLGNGPDGCLEICHGGTGNWDASKTCIGILFKGMLWCEAYAVHLRTGLDISEIFENWRRRQMSWKQNETGSKDSLEKWLGAKTLETSWLTIDEPNPFELTPLWTPITQQRQHPRTILSFAEGENDSYFRRIN